jgi:hypothetical protein
MLMKYQNALVDGHIVLQMGICHVLSVLWYCTNIQLELAT